MPSPTLVPAETLSRQILAVFSAWGMSDEDAAAAAEVMVDTDLRGIDSHGIGMLPTYQKRYEEGAINPRPKIRLLRESPSTALLDADQSLGHPPSRQAMRMAIAKAKASGIGVVAVTNSNHYGAAGYYSLQAARDGVIGLSLTSAASSLVVPTFGRQAAYGTNPIAFAAPAEINVPFSLDMATSTVAFGKLNVARRAGKAIPQGWALDDRGAPTTDPDAALAARRLAPLGGSRDLGSHKGYGLAVMVEILCATLTGVQPGLGQVGHFFLAIAPAHFRPEGSFESDLDTLLNRLRATVPADPEQPVLVAGDAEYEIYRRRSREGIPVTATLAQEIRSVCRAVDAPFLLGR